MNTTNYIPHEETAYALLIRSQREEGSLPETAVYLLLIMTMAFSVWQSALQLADLPRIGLLRPTPMVQAAETPQPAA